MCNRPDIRLKQVWQKHITEYTNMIVLHLPELDCSAVLQATPQGLLPPSSAELPHRSVVSSPPVCQIGTAPGPSAGCALPLQGRKRADEPLEYSVSFVNISHHPWLLTTITISVIIISRKVNKWLRVCVPLILSTVEMISPRAYIRALSSIGLPSFKLSFFRSALRRFFDDLLWAVTKLHHSSQRLQNLNNKF